MVGSITKGYRATVLVFCAEDLKICTTIQHHSDSDSKNP